MQEIDQNQLKKDIAEYTERNTTFRKDFNNELSSLISQINKDNIGSIIAKIVHDPEFTEVLNSSTLFTGKQFDIENCGYEFIGSKIVISLVIAGQTINEVAVKLSNDDNFTKMIDIASKYMGADYDHDGQKFISSSASPEVLKEFQLVPGTAALDDQDYQASTSDLFKVGYNLGELVGDYCDNHLVLVDEGNGMHSMHLTFDQI